MTVYSVRIMPFRQNAVYSVQQRYPLSRMRFRLFLAGRHTSKTFTVTLNNVSVR